ncbi:MAG: cell envelope integrity protein TolA [Gammaproteobacteria bacterium]|nr:cell envelope integrity protein TolA [Gammaproteobacteria bacterium]
MDRFPQQKDPLFWPAVWAVAIHVALLSLLFVSFSSTPELPPARPIVKATLYQLESQNMATTQTSHKIAGEAEQTRTQDYAQEQLEQKKREQEREAAARRKAEEERQVALRQAEQKAEQERKQAEQQRQAEQKAEQERKQQAEQKLAEERQKAAEQKRLAEQKAAEQKKLELQKAEAARLKAVEEAKARAEAERKKAEELKKKAEAERKKAEEQKQKAEAERKKAEEQKQKAEAERKKAEADKKKREAEQAVKVAAEKAREAERRAQEDRTAAALAELLGDGPTQRQSTVADRQGEQQAGRIDDLIVQLVSQNWSRPDAARNGMRVELDVEFLPDGTVSRAVVARSSGNPAFDNSALAAVRNVVRVREIQNLDRATYERFYRKRRLNFSPEDLSQ